MSEYDDIWNAPDDVGREPGVYLAEIAECVRRFSREGQPNLSIRFVAPGTESVLCFDRLNLAGKPAALSLTKRRLKALGFQEGDKPIAEDLKGRLVWIALALGKKKEDGRQFLEVDAWRRDSHGGYWAENDPPEEVKKPKACPPTGTPTAAPTPAPSTEDVPW